MEIEIEIDKLLEVKPVQAFLKVRLELTKYQRDQLLKQILKANLDEQGK